jgi:predicted NAD-dependent protein-ADP-ribosyltransferase YbiA (DUF1768 family)
MFQLEGDKQQASAPDATASEVQANAAKGMLAESQGRRPNLEIAAAPEAKLSLSSIMYLAATPPSERPVVAEAPAKAPEPTKGVFNNLAHSFAYTLVQAPVDGVSQLFDKGFGTSLQKSVHFMDAPVAAKFGTSDWAAQQVGGAAGMIAPYLLLHKGVSAAAGRPYQSLSLAGGQSLSRFALAESGVAAAAGTIYGGVFTPVNPDSKNFWGDRFANAATTGITFGTLSGTSIGLQGLGRSMTAQGRTTAGRVLTNEIFAGVASSLPAGIVHADSTSLFAGRGLATGKERMESITTFAMVGGLFGAGHRFLSRPKAQTGETNTAVSESQTGGTPIVWDKPVMLGEPLKAAEVGKTAQPVERPVADKAADAAALPILEVGKPSTRYRGVEPDAIVERIIDTKDGGKIVLFSNGEKVVDIPGEPIRTQKAAGRVVIEQRDGKVLETRIKNQIPPDEKPLNVASGAFESIGKNLSNFAERPFTLDGRTYASVEAFYQGLKWPDAAKRAEVAVLTGKEAKFSAREAPKSQTFEYEGQTYKLGSPEHHQLIKRAIRESLEQNPAIMKEFLETSPRPIEHKTGRRENPRSAFPGSTFTRILTELRTELLEKHGTSKDVTPPVVPANEVSMGANKSVSDVLRAAVESGQIPEKNTLSTYAKALENLPLRAKEYMGVGGDSVVVRLEDGNILKLTQRTDLPQSRSFDLPVLDKGTVIADQITINWFVQPEAKVPIAAGDFMPFLQRIRQEGYRMTDPSDANLGYYNGETKLVDPFAVTRIPEQYRK